VQVVSHLNTGVTLLQERPNVNTHSTEILWKALMGPMNDQLKQMAFLAENATGSQPDGTLQVYKPQEGSIYASFTGVGGKHTEGDGVG
jgi:hypothetical protein